MKKSERNAIIKWANGLSNEELEKEYYNLAYSRCVSQVEPMYELGYDMEDVLKREGYETFMFEKFNLLETLCVKRGIELWNF